MAEPQQGLHAPNFYIEEFEGYFQDDGTFHPGHPPLRADYSDSEPFEYIESLDGYFDSDGHFHSGQPE